LPLEKRFKIANLAGFKTIELMLYRSNNPDSEHLFNIDLLKKLQEEFQIRITTVHAPESFSKDKIIREKTYNLIKQLKPRYMVFHIPNRSELDYIKWFKDKYLNRNKLGDTLLLAELSEHLERDPIIKEVEDIAKLPSVCFDIAHTLKIGRDPLEEMKQLDNIYEIHVSFADKGKCHQGIIENKEIFIKTLTNCQIEEKVIEVNNPRAYARGINLIQA